MTDLALVLGTIAFFAASIAYVAGCDAIVRLPLGAGRDGRGGSPAPSGDPVARDRHAGPGGRS